MIELRATIEPAMADPLEEHFLGEVRSCWLLVQETVREPYVLSGFFADEAEGRAAWADLRMAFPELPTAPELRAVADEDWKEAYKLHFHPWTSRGLHWVPEWRRHDYPVPTGDRALYLDPGMAFGTGNHETTRLCAERLLDVRADRAAELPRLRVIDAGCGSGILALSAALMGYGEVWAFDHDPEAIAVSHENAARNGLGRPVVEDPVTGLAIRDGALEFAQAGLEDGLAGHTGDVVVANIFADVLMVYAGELLVAVAPGGTLVLSGILAKELERVRAYFEARLPAAWGAPAVWAEGVVLGEWSSLTFRRG